MTSPKQKYTDDLESGLIVFDAMQEQVVSHLQALFDELVVNGVSSEAKNSGLSGLLAGLLSRQNAIDKGTNGLYI
ncbi:MAG TPA: hypothetical protein DCL66_14270, partial [Gammaproteobacteria bacterium]|nr:hypothetical protein [Gammaproteobacteria bacterium]